MKNTILSIFVISSALTVSAAVSDNHGYPIDPVPFTSVTVDDSFWSPRLEASRNTTIPLAFSKCEETGRYDNFVKATKPSDSYKVEGFPFDDTDVYKTIEGASYLLQTYPDPKLEAYIDSVLVLVAAAQEPDGYLNTSYTMNPAHPHPWMGPGRWDKVEDLSHEFYNLGHMVEGAVAHWRATGKRNFLDIACRYADCVVRSIGYGDDQRQLVPGHQIAEMALAKLYLATGKKEYLDQAKFFLDMRGKTSRKDAYSQAHKPVIEQDEAVGHAVRAAYMYAGMADVAALTGDSAYIAAIDRIWENIAGKKLYITGGIGARHAGESFGDNYELPNEEAYCETCAAIGNVYVNHRLFLLHGDSKYYDVLERTLYNGLISGVSIDGGGFFYPNPLASHGQHQREPWFGCACCPSNISRFIPSLPGYIYAVNGRDVYVNLYIGNSSKIKVDGKSVHLGIDSRYTDNGSATIRIDRNSAGAFDLRLRIPSWAQNTPVPGDLYAYADGKTPRQFEVTVNGSPAEGSMQQGYFTINRKWRKGDVVEVKFDNSPRIVAANPKVKANRGRLAVERGPIVYCAEWPDNDFNIHSAILSPKATFAETRSNILGGIHTLSAPAQLMTAGNDGRFALTDTTLTLIPYYAWAHRGKGNMAVWLAAAPAAVELGPVEVVTHKIWTGND